MDFTKEKIRKLADLLMIGLTDEEANDLVSYLIGEYKY